VLGCYSFPVHVVTQHEGMPWGIDLPTLRQSLTAEFGEVAYAAGTSIDGGETDGIAEAVAVARDADVVIIALGDRAGLFGRGTSGEGCDAESLALPGAQQQLLDAVLDAGVPTVVTMLAGRPYALGSAVERAAAIVQTFFPGEEGTVAIASVLSGKVNPGGRLPVSIPASPGVHPSTYLAAPLARRSGVSNLDPTAAFPFGSGIGYTAFEWSDASAQATEVATDGTVELSITVRNAGDRAGSDVVQLYLHDPVASVVRPVQRLIGFRKVRLDAGAEVRLTVAVPADLASFTGRDGRRIVEPGELVLSFARSSAELVAEQPVVLTGPVREVGFERELHPIWHEA
jgi:beta-xylosidase